MNKKFCFVNNLGREAKEVVAYRQAKSLQDSGYDVVHLVFDDGPETTINGVKILSVGAKHGGYLKRIFIGPWLILRRLIEINADVYQTNSLEHIFIFLIMRILGKKIIFFLREEHPYTFYNTSSLPKKITHILVLMMALWMRYTLRWFNVVFTNDVDCEVYLKKWKVKNVIIIGNFPYVNKNYKLTFEDYSQRENRIIYYGTIYNLSCQEQILTALSNIGSVNYLLAGKFWANEYYHKELEKHKGWNYVEFIDGFDSSELSALLKRSTISNVVRDFSKMYIPNGSLGIIKIFESMEAGLPIICSDVPVYREIMKKYKCGILIDPTDPKQFEKAIKTLIGDKRKAYEMGQEGRRAVIEKYSWDVESKKYISVINKFFIKDNVSI